MRSNGAICPRGQELIALQALSQLAPGKHVLGLHVDETHGEVEAEAEHDLEKHGERVQGTLCIRRERWEGHVND